MPAGQRAGGVWVFKTHGGQLCLCRVSSGWGRGGGIRSRTFFPTWKPGAGHPVPPAHHSSHLGPGRPPLGGSGGKGRRGGGGAGQGGKETGELPPHPRATERRGPPRAASQPGEALTGFTRVLVIYHLLFFLFVSLKSVIIVEASADPQLPAENNPRGHQPPEHPRGERSQPHPPPREETEGTGPDREERRPRSALMCGGRGDRRSSPRGEAPRRDRGAQVSGDMRVPWGQ